MKRAKDDYCPHCGRGKRKHSPCPPPYDWGAEIRATIMSLPEDDPVRLAYEGKRVIK